MTQKPDAILLLSIFVVVGVLMSHFIFSSVNNEKGDHYKNYPMERIK